MQRVLILCTGNSARSQMAEGLLRDIGGSFPDPASVEGSDEEVLAAFVHVRDDIEVKLREWVA